MNNSPIHRPHIARHLGGFSLVEILIGLMLGLLLMAGVLQLFVSNSQTYRFQDAASRMQENGRFALDMLAHGIRVAGFTGCPSTNSLTNVLNNKTAWWEDFGTNQLMGYDGTSTQIFPGEAFTTANGNRIPGTDAVISLGGDGGIYFVTGSTPTGSPPSFSLNTRQRPDGTRLAGGDVAIVCNTQNTSLFQVTRGQSTPSIFVEHAQDNSRIPGNSTPNLFPGGVADNYVPNQAMMVDYVPTAFYIGTSTSGTTRSLRQEQLQTSVSVSTVTAGMSSQELVEGVQDMQIFYGEDTNADGVADAYLDATNITTWAKVTSVRINLLLASLEDNIVSQPQTYTFPSDTGDSANFGRRVTATDRRLYQTFSTTIGIRNRLQ